MVDGEWKPSGLLEATVSLDEAILMHAETLSVGARQNLARKLLRLNRRSMKKPGLRERLGVWIKENRKLRGLSQAVAAESLGVVRPSLANYERGGQSCTMEMFIAMCDLFDLEPVDQFWKVVEVPEFKDGT